MQVRELCKQFLCICTMHKNFQQEKDSDIKISLPYLFFSLFVVEYVAVVCLLFKGERKMQTYSQLCKEQRNIIEDLLNKNFTFTEIGKSIKDRKSTRLNSSH